MKAKEARPSFPVPRDIGRSEGDMIARGMGRQLDLFREIMTPPAKLQMMAMMALSDPKRMDKPTAARVADIARTMGYDQAESGQFPGSTFEDIIKTGWKLKVKVFDVFFREPSGTTRTGRLKYRTGIRTLSILQEFNRYYEDEDGQPIDLDSIPKDAIKTLDQETPPIYLIPMMDERGNILRDDDGAVRVRRASGISWTWSSRIAEATKDQRTAWVFYSDAIQILRRYLKQPAAFNLMFLTLFWINDHPEMSHEKLTAHLDIRGKDQDQVNRAIDAAFQAAFNEGIIDKPVQIRPAGYYKPTKKTGKERRKGMVYQWHRAGRWRAGKVLPMVKVEGQLEGYNDGKPEKPKA